MSQEYPWRPGALKPQFYEDNPYLRRNRTTCSSDISMGNSKAAEQHETGGRLPFIPYHRAEVTIASHGLREHIDIVYKSATKSSIKPDAGLRAVYYLLNDNIQRYRDESVHTLDGLRKVLDVETNTWRAPEEIVEHYAAAPALSQFLVAEEAKRTGNYRPLKGSRATNYLYEKYKIIQNMPADEVLHLCERAYVNSQQRLRFWMVEVDGVENHPVILNLLDAIENTEIPGLEYAGAKIEE